MEFGFSMRGQYPAGTDMQDSFAKACELARTANKLGYTYITKDPQFSRPEMCISASAFGSFAVGMAK